jgi:hypothetical protein
LLTIAGFLFWRLLPLNGFQTMAIGLMSIEGLNTAVEKKLILFIQVMKKSVS